MASLGLQRSSVLRKNGKSKIWLGEKKNFKLHIFFSRQIQYKMLLLITVHPFALKVVGGQPETFRSK